MSFRSILCFGLLSSAVACGSVSVESESDGGLSDAATVGLDGGAVLEDGGPGVPGPELKFQFDYRFDKKGFFSDPKRRAALEAAGRIWGKRIKSTFSNIPKGTFILVRDPQQPTVAAQSFNIDYEIDDVLVFVGSAELGADTLGIAAPSFGISGVTDQALATSLSDRSGKVPFQPWTAWCAFDETTSWFFDDSPDSSLAVPADQMDFITVALHELGHVLGFGTAEAFKAQITAGKFVGKKAVALYGGPVPLSGGAHFPKGVLGSDEHPLMDVSDPNGRRSLPLPLDIAVFEDLGYQF